MLKYTEQEVRDHIRRYGTDHASDDVKEVAKDMAAEEFDVLKHQKLPMFEMPNGNICSSGITGKPTRSMPDRLPVRIYPTDTASLTTIVSRWRPTCKA